MIDNNSYTSVKKGSIWVLKNNVKENAKISV